MPSSSPSPPPSAPRRALRRILLRTLRRVVALPASALHAWDSLPPGRLAVALAVACLAVLAALVPGRTPLHVVWGDEGTFLAMAESVAEDGDLRFGRPDLERVRAATGGRTHLILQRAGDGELAYSKPVVYPLLVAPLWLLFGAWGPLMLNALALCVSLWLAHAYLRRLARRHDDDEGWAALALVGFVGAGLVVPYVFWRMADLVQLCLALVGLVLLLARRRTGEADPPAGPAERLLVHPAAPWMGTALLAVLPALRVTNGLIAVLPVLLALWQRRWRRAVAYALLVAGVILGLQQLSLALTGATNPYRAVRASFTAETGYPVSEESLSGDAGPTGPVERFEVNRASHGTRVETPAAPRQVAYSALYFLAGRHTGLLFYFPAALLLLWLGLRRGDAAGRISLLVFLGTVAFFVGWKPTNYFGGETFLGNRYLLPAYPLLLLAIRRLPPPRAWLGVWIVACLAYGSAATSVARTHGLDRTSQNHAYAGVFRLLPYESTARSLDGRRDRYWSEAFLRFVDPYARVDGTRFRLHAGDPPAELLVASWWPPEDLTFDVVVDPAALGDAPDPVLRIADWATRRHVSLGGPDAARIRGGDGHPLLHHRVEIEPATPWRRHRFWFGGDSLFWVTALRLDLETGDGTPAAADVFFVGDPDRRARTMARSLRSWSLPEPPVAGETGIVSVEVENASPLPWTVRDVTAVTARWILRRRGEVAAESGRLELPGPVDPGAAVELHLPVRWPDEPGIYELEVDLVLERVAWFQEAVGEPLLRREIRVEPSEPRARRHPRPE